MRPRTFIRLALLVSTLPSFCVVQGQPHSRKKLIATGWDQADSARFAQNIHVMEKQPFAGVFMVVNGTKDNGKSCRLRSVQAA